MRTLGGGFNLISPRQAIPSKASFFEKEVARSAGGLNRPADGGK